MPRHAGACCRPQPEPRLLHQRCINALAQSLIAGRSKATVSDLRPIIRVAQGRQGPPKAVGMDGRTLQSSDESRTRAGYEGCDLKRGSKVHMPATARVMNAGGKLITC